MARVHVDYRSETVIATLRGMAFMTESWGFQGGDSELRSMRGRPSPPNGLEMSCPASSSNLHYTRFAAAGRVGSIELLGARLSASYWACRAARGDPRVSLPGSLMLALPARA